MDQRILNRKIPNYTEALEKEGYSHIQFKGTHYFDWGFLCARRSHIENFTAQNNNVIVQGYICPTAIFPNSKSKGPYYIKPEKITPITEPITAH